MAKCASYECVREVIATDKLDQGDIKLGREKSLCKYPVMVTAVGLYVWVHKAHLNYQSMLVAPWPE